MWRFLLFAVLAAADFRGADEILVPGKPWELLGEGYQLTADSTVDKDGNVYFSDAQKNGILKIDLEGKISVWKDGTNHTHGVAFGADGRLYGGQHDLKRIVAFSRDGVESVIAEGMQTHHLIVTSRNEIYFTVPPARQVWRAEVTGAKRVVHEGLEWPRGVRASADRSTLVVNDARSRWVWRFRIERDGSLANGRRFYQLESRDESGPDPGGMDFDSEGFLYVATKLGVQVFDRRGRRTAILDLPTPEGASSVFFGGAGFKWLYLTEWNKIYRRPVNRRRVSPLNRRR